MSKNKEKEEPKTKKVEQVESEYSFPEYGITVKAKDQHEALEKVKKIRGEEQKGVRE